jgi:large subunit ribosomal protein L3
VIVHNIIFHLREDSANARQVQGKTIMTVGLLGYKLGMTQVYDDKGRINPVTVLQVGPCPVLLVRNQERDGYDAVQVGLGEKKRPRPGTQRPHRKSFATRADRGHVSADFESKRRQAGGKPLAAKANCEPPLHTREFRLDQAAGAPEVGKILTVGELFNGVVAVDVTGTTKGRGFQGVMKRHGFAGLPASHGAKKVHRSRGSIGSHASNRGFGRPKKGQRAAGHYGHDHRTLRNLKVVRIDADNNLLLVKGAVPGPTGGFIVVRPTNKKDQPNPEAAAQPKKGGKAGKK